MGTRPPWEGEDITDFLVNLEPFKQGMDGMPIKQIRYSDRKVEIEFFSPLEFERLWIDWDDLGELL